MVAERSLMDIYSSMYGDDLKEFSNLESPSESRDAGSQGSVENSVINSAKNDKCTYCDGKITTPNQVYHLTMYKEIQGDPPSVDEQVIEIPCCDTCLSLIKARKAIESKECRCKYVRSICGYEYLKAIHAKEGEKIPIPFGLWMVNDDIYLDPKDKLCVQYKYGNIPSFLTLYRAGYKLHLPASTKKPDSLVISLSSFPSMPMTWSGIDSGEAWDWGDYVVLLHKRPVTVSEAMMAMAGKSKSYIARNNGGIIYEYALIGLFKDENSQGVHSSRPAFCLCIETSDATIGGPPMFGVFTPAARINGGSYYGELNRDSIKAFLLDKARFYVKAGDPKYVGNFENARLVLHGKTPIPQFVTPPSSDGSVPRSLLMLFMIIGVIFVLCCAAVLVLFP